MNREPVLAFVLVLSLCANAYFIFVVHTSSVPDAGGLVPALIPDSYDPGNSTEISGVSNSTDDLHFSGHESEFEGESGENNEYPDQGTTEPVTTASRETILVTPTPDGWVAYTSKKHAFSIRYPVTWELDDASTGSPGRVVVLTAPPETECDSYSAQCFKYIATMTIEIDQDPHTLSLEEYFNSAVSSLQKSHAITSTSKSAPCMLSGNRAYQIEFYTRNERGNPDRSYMQYYTLIDKKGYIISYTGPYSSWENVFSHNKGDAQRIIDSFDVERTYEVV
ncbi:MAG TPA: PsbP-related protein [Methanoregulaceae archaeon]|nr:MAG: hypothetical protein IPI71_00980 [Methanolinea sp.]HON80898.1 PsbP-related protein [Methanoregulaceae archaeon]HPD09636.1 PsbP-related protein [Methanoregulaceae archaeon]HRT15304.1 PsbP-related protein [Methanoregulaceae archaeon]HRU30875.1 PsbP-related protein [Methanoregulaceae archaeon]